MNIVLKFMLQMVLNCSHGFMIGHKYSPKRQENLKKLIPLQNKKNEQ